MLKALFSERLMPLVILVVLVPLVAFAQGSDADVASRLEALTLRLEALDRESGAIRAEIDALRSLVAGAASVPADDLTQIEGALPAATEDLTKIDAVPAPAASDGSLAGVDVIENAPSAAVSKIFNPDIAIIGNVVAHAGGDNPEERDAIALQESELSLEAAVDPYAKAKFFIGYSDEEVAVEEGYIQFVALPWDLSAKVGKMKASFGKFNPTHFHTWSTTDAPLVNATFFGEEGLADSGVSVSKLIPAGAFLVEATAEAFRGSVEGVFEPGRSSDLFYDARLRAYRDLTENSNIDVGASFATGTLPETGGSSRFTGIDVSYRWKPLSRAIYRSFLARGELIVNDRDGGPDSAVGYYASADYQFARRWLAGARIDGVDRPDDPSITDRGQSLMLTFRPSEFSLIRGQYRRTDYGDGFEADEFLLQFQFGIGAHGAHPF
ncbi:MAG: hypothetical protein HYU52_04515 [Acidobacteria bacterium]|nr:hypothetical protein [Acidobacteriota bacterium]